MYDIYLSMSCNMFRGGSMTRCVYTSTTVIHIICWLCNIEQKGISSQLGGCSPFYREQTVTSCVLFTCAVISALPRCYCKLLTNYGHCISRLIFNNNTQKGLGVS